MNLALTVLLLALYSSTELITAERERGTMVLLAVAPPARRDVLIGKILVVFLTCFLGAMLSLAVHFGLTALFVHEMADTVGSFTMALPVLGSVLCVLLTLPMVAFLAAASFALACFVRNFQQAQSYASVLLIACLLPALATVVGTKTYPPIVAILPIANNALAMRDALSGALEPGFAIATLLSSALYAFCAVFLATRLLDSEHAIYPHDEPPDTWRWTARWLVLFLGAVFLAYFIIGQPLQSADTLIGLAASQVFLIALPVFIFLHWLRLPWRNLLSLRAPRSLLTLPAAVLLAPLTVLLAWSIAGVQDFVLPSPKQLNDMMMQFLLPHGRPVWLVFAAVAGAPAICEELLFRGCVQGVLLRVLPPRVVLPITAVGFGMFHMSTFRLLPTAVLGYALCLLTYRYGSIFPSMVLHFCHNALATWISMHHIDPLDWRNVALALASGICGLLLLRAADAKRGDVPK
jgi:sodium transport system permease protein